MSRVGREEGRSREEGRTPSEDRADHGVRAARDAEGREVARVLVRGDSEEQSVLDTGASVTDALRPCQRS